MFWKKQIWKYVLADLKNGDIGIPEGAKFLALQPQDGEMMMWFEVDPQQRKVSRKFEVIGTGQSFGGGVYLGTYQSGPFVWHVYELECGK